MVSSYTSGYSELGQWGGNRVKRRRPWYLHHCNPLLHTAAFPANYFGWLISLCVSIKGCFSLRSNYIWIFLRPLQDGLQNTQVGLHRNCDSGFCFSTPLPFSFFPAISPQLLDPSWIIIRPLRPTYPADMPTLTQWKGQILGMTKGGTAGFLMIPFVLPLFTDSYLLQLIQAQEGQSASLLQTLPHYEMPLPFLQASASQPGAQRGSLFYAVKRKS